MSAIVTPRQLAQRAELYQQLGQLTSAGIGLVQALEIQQRHPPSRSFCEPIRRILGALAVGSTFADALNAAGNWITAFDAALLRAGEQSGRLPATFRQLADHYENNARLLRQMISGLVYPALLFHLAIFIFPLPEFFRSWNIASYLARTLGVLVPVYGAGAFVIYAMQGQHGEAWRSQVERLLRRVPLLGKARKNLCLARLASALEALISAGVSIVEAWPLAANACGSPALRRAIVSWKPGLEMGQTPSEALRQSREFPELFANMYNTGEVTGTLDDTLRRLHVLYREEGSRQLQAVADWTPKLIYFGVALLVGWQVIRFWTGYFNQISDIIK
jgi:type II secretory pathway component PulF